MPKTRRGGRKAKLRRLIAKYLQDLQNTAALEEAKENSTKSPENNNSSSFAYKLIPLTIEYRPLIISKIPEGDPRRTRYLEIHSEISQQIKMKN